MSTKKKLEEVFGKIEPSTWNEAARKQKENKGWIHYSQEVALALLELMDQRNMTQKALAEQMNVSPQLINKWVKGKENFTFETVGKLEAVFGIKLLKVEISTAHSSIQIEHSKTFTEEYERPRENSGMSNSFRTAKVISMPQTNYSKTGN